MQQLELFDTKRCYKCEKTKFTFVFCVSRNLCKNCKKLEDEQRRNRNRVYVLEYLKTHHCVDCGENNPLVLVFDHLRDKKYEVSDLIRKGYKLEKLIEEISKTQILCQNCHAIKTALSQNWYKLQCPSN